MKDKLELLSEQYKNSCAENDAALMVIHILKAESESLRQKLAVAEDTLEWIALPNAYHNETNINEPYSAKLAREALAEIRGKDEYQ